MAVDVLWTLSALRSDVRTDKFQWDCAMDANVLPWAHLGLGYLWYSIGMRVNGATPAETPALGVAIGTQLPDLIDKPLSWHFGVLPTGRSFGHSVFFLVGLAVLTLVMKRRLSHSYPVLLGFVVGVGSHLVGDSIWTVVAGEFDQLDTFLWPVVEGTTLEHEKGILSHLLAVDGTLEVLVGIGIALLGGVMWRADQYPGAGLPRKHLFGVITYLTRPD